MALKFEGLEVWKRALDFACAIDQTTRTFPKEELYILTSQMKRAANSVALNLAEGSTGQSDAEFSRFLGFSIRSAIEVIACLHIGRRQGIVTDATFEDHYQHAQTMALLHKSTR